MTPVLFLFLLLAKLEPSFLLCLSYLTRLALPGRFPFRTLKFQRFLRLSAH